MITQTIIIVRGAKANADLTSAGFIVEINIREQNRLFTLEFQESEIEVNRPFSNECVLKRHCECEKDTVLSIVYSIVDPCFLHKTAFSPLRPTIDA